MKGFYSESLTPTLVQELGMKPAAYIDIDCDLYISSKQALAYMFEQKLAVPGTLIGYDDFWVNPCCEGYEKMSPALFIRPRGGFAAGRQAELVGARSPLYRSQILQPNTHSTPFFKIYKMDILLHRSNLNFLRFSQNCATCR